MPRSIPALTLSVLVAGCAAPISAPPLEKRPFENQAVLLPEEAREPAAPADPSLTARLADLVREGAAAHDRFGRQRQDVERLVRTAAAAAPGSEPWTVAQQAVSALETARGPLRQAIGSLERISQEPAQAGSGARTATEAAADRLAGWDDEEGRTVSGLAARLR